MVSNVLGYGIIKNPDTFVQNDTFIPNGGKHYYMINFKNIVK